MKLVACIPTVARPHAATLAALEACYPAVVAAGWSFDLVCEIGNAYISGARSVLTRKAMEAGADVVVYIDHDVSWQPNDLLALIEADGDVVAGTYRYKREPADYMGFPLDDGQGRAHIRHDGAIEMFSIPAGFMRITRAGIEKFATGYPHLVYGQKLGQRHVDLFNHGAHDDVWYGEDYAFSRNWRALGEKIWLLPKLRIDHHTGDQVWRGCYHDYLISQQQEAA